MRTLFFASLLLAACAGKSPPQVAADSPGGGQDCTTYCNIIQGACTGANGQYSSMDTCVASCSHFPMGTAADTSGDTLGCRIYHAMNAVTDPNTHCIHAGPSGGGVCGMPCDGFCSLVVAECPTQYPSAATCATDCAGYAPLPPYSAMVTSGDTLSCRIYHATAASTDPATHCPHTGLDGGGVCQ
ncbi:MAG TPA: hypothetical protein VLX92_15445 [Kofleriaceae bacterium]|nr:hypothetical protein [Kofleriaceae bacterium]